MPKQEQYSKLRDAYAIIDGIPEDVFDLSAIIREKGKSLECGTIACAAGWIGLHPTLAKHMKPERVQARRTTRGYLNWKIADERRTTSYKEAMAHLFNISIRDAENLFTVRGFSAYDGYIQKGKAGRVVSDKQLWLARVREFLQEKSAL